MVVGVSATSSSLKPRQIVDCQQLVRGRDHTELHGKAACNQGCDRIMGGCVKGRMIVRTVW